MPVMKGVIPAAGKATRLFPATKSLPKALLPVGRKPLLLYSIEGMVEAGVRDILIITAKEHIGTFAAFLGDGSEFCCDIHYKIQEQPGGIAQALSLSESFAGGDSMLVILGDNVFFDSLRNPISYFLQEPRGAKAKVALKEVYNPSRFGVAEIKDNSIISVEEKPNKPKSSLAVVGIYMYDSSVFDIIREMKPSKVSGEFEITDVNEEYLRRGELDYWVLKKYWSDIGTFESLYQTSDYIMNVMGSWPEGEV